MKVFLTEGVSTSQQAMDALSTGLGSIADAMGNAIVTIMPVALGIAGTVMAVKFGVKLFRHFTSKN